MNTPEVQAHFRAQVSDYPALMRRLVPFYDEQRRLIRSLIPFERTLELRVLDLGCGPGLMAAEILADFPYSRIALVDVTSEMIDVCKAHLGADDRATYQVGDFRTEDFGSGYDLIIARCRCTTCTPESGRDSFDACARACPPEAG